MKDTINLFAFIILIVGTAGLLVNEFIFDMGRTGTIVFAAFNVVGLIILAIAYFRRKSRETN